MSRRIRRTPYTNRVESFGVSGFSVVNHMLFPKGFGNSIESDYWHLHENVQIWDVSCQRQVEITGRDAARLAQWMTPRDLRKAQVGQCLYLPLIDDAAGIVNDPVLLKLAEDRFWFSIADSDVLLWAKGLALGASLNVTVFEPDVSPLAVQGPKAEEVMACVFGEQIRNLEFFKFGHFSLFNTSQIVARSGYSKMDGFEIYLNDSDLGEELWDLIFQAGKSHQIRPGCPNLIDRVEAGLLSYGNELTKDNNPLECRLKQYCDLSDDIDYVGKRALQAIAQRGVERKMRGVVFGGESCAACTKPWPVYVDNCQVGQITTGIYSPRLKKNIGLSMINSDFWDYGQAVDVHVSNTVRSGEVTHLPFAY